ncbi:MAG TPA: S9 family peptidase [Acidimicrobiales bacterium]|jgi:oligopeptidase B|nr:S9 family peptidase [Acidimicrobiales bacterium]
MTSPPSAPRRPHVISAHDDDRDDPWFWLREREDPEVLAYLEAENAYTEEATAPLAAFRTRLFEEMKARIKETDMSVPTRRGPWWYYSRTEEGKDYGIHCRRPARGLQELPPAGEPGEEEQVLLDENVLAAGSDYFAVGSAAVSHDHRWLAYSTDRQGNEKYELQFRPLDAGIPSAPEVVPDTGYGLAWAGDADYVFYVRMDDAQRPFQLWRHQVGRDPAGDVLVFEEADRRFTLGTGTTRDQAWVLIGLHSTNTSEWLAIPTADPLAEPRVVLPRREGVEYAVDHLTPAAPATPATPATPDAVGWFLVLTNDEAQDFRVLAAPDSAALEGGTPREVWREVIPHRPGTRIEDVDAFSRALVVSERAEAQTQVRVLPLPAPVAVAVGDHAASGVDPFAGDLLENGWIIPSIESPSSTWLGANSEPDPQALRFGRTSMVTPSSVLQITLGEREETLLKQEPVLGDFDPDLYTTYREWAVAPDGTRVPISVVHRKDLELPAPLVLYGYGAYEMSIDPSFSPHRLSLYDRGVAFAIAHVRGGGEMGRTWYEDGRMEHKQNTFTDFIACGRHMVEAGIARPGQLVGRGGSAGGLLIGAVANQAPELFRALVAEVPFVDCVTTMLDDELPLTVGEWEEWGNPLADESAYFRMLTYSPYDNVTAQNPDGSPRTYPDLFVTAGLNDPRVAYWEPAKWVAKLRAESPSTRVFLKTELGAGHGGPSGRYDAWKEEALVYTFLLDVLGLAERG